MLGKKSEKVRDNIIKLISKEVQDRANIHSARIHLESRNLAVTMESKGLLGSGNHCTQIDILLKQEVDTYVDEIFEAINRLQSEMNIRFTDEELDVIESELLQMYKSLVRMNNQLHSAWTDIRSASSDLANNLMMQNTNIKSRIETLKIKNKETKDRPEVRLTKKQYYLNMLGLVLSVTLSIIAILVSLFKK